jgi:hypothetical protein
VAGQIACDVTLLATDRSQQATHASIVPPSGPARQGATVGVMQPRATCGGSGRSPGEP